MLSQWNYISVLGVWGIRANEKNVSQFPKFSLSTVSQPHSQFWGIIKRTASSLDVGHQKSRNKGGSLSLARHLVRFEQETFQMSCHNSISSEVSRKLKGHLRVKLYQV